MALLALAIWICAPRTSVAQPAEVPLPSTQSPSNSLSGAKEGPQRLKQQVRITVETNAPSTTATNQVTPKKKFLDWKFSWEGWDGLHTEIAQKTYIKDPIQEFRREVAGTNAYQVFHLEEIKVSGKIGVKLAVDAAGFVTGHQFQGFDDNLELRRVRVYAKGDCLLLLPVSYEFELGYVPNSFFIENSYLAFRDIPWIGEFKGGQYKAPMGLDFITSSRDVTFMEPSAALEALAPGVNAGIQIGRPVFDQRATWRLGLFTQGAGQDSGDATKDYGRAIMRFTGLPIYNAGSDQTNDPPTLLHLGLSANILYSSSGAVRYQSRPESHLAPFVLDTGDIDADSSTVAGAEAAWVKGPLSLQGEFLYTWVKEKSGVTPNFCGLYGSASWFLTGESRPYNQNEGAFGRVIPKEDFNFGHGGWGAWEIAGRYSFVNLDSEDVQGGRLSMLMGELNWYLHSHVKWRFNYGFGHVSGKQPSGNINVLQTRIEIDF
jgi:phosphate-selective porin OprO/OprP